MSMLSGMWHAAASAFADHLWQSTMVAGIAGLLTFVLRTNSARLRYSIWFAASLKFLVPFSLLISLGGAFSWRTAPSSASPGIYSMEVLSQPFTKSLPLAAPLRAPSTSSAILVRLLPLLPWVWLAGFLVVLSVWMVRWFRVSAMIRQATLLSEGREFTALGRLGHLTRSLPPLTLRLSGSSLEPGVFGIFRPALLWPRSISNHLEDDHLEAVIAHELVHVRRRDNLAAALHMLVEAIFWFHPFVWWIGLRLIDERERACDEAVLELGSRPRTYAESILKVCEFCLSSPLTCVSGVTGADLKKRMVHIMTDHVVRKLNLSRKLLLWACACLVIVLPIAYGLLAVTPSRAESSVGSVPKFASVTIKPHPAGNDGLATTKMMMKIVGIGEEKDNSGFMATNVSLHALIQNAYRVQETQLTGEPEWMKTDRYDINATVAASFADQVRGLNEKQRELIGQQMLQQLLADYFKLSLHQESRDLPAYELVAAEGGVKLQNGGKLGMITMNIGEISAKGAPMQILVAQLSRRLGRTVMDKTGLTGNYDFTLRWTPDAEELGRVRAAMSPQKLVDDQPTTPTDSAPPLITAVQEQLGLKLQPQVERLPVIVVDHAEQPTN